MKTCSEWNGDLNVYLQVGDIVDRDIYEHFRDVLPPAHFTSKMVQLGEPYDFAHGRPTYPTLVKTPEGWMYKGNCRMGGS